MSQVRVTDIHCWKISSNTGYMLSKIPHQMWPSSVINIVRSPSIILLRHRRPMSLYFFVFFFCLCCRFDEKDVYTAPMSIDDHGPMHGSIHGEHKIPSHQIGDGMVSHVHHEWNRALTRDTKIPSHHRSAVSTWDKLYTIIITTGFISLQHNSEAVIV